MNLALGNLLVILAAIGLAEPSVWWFRGSRSWGYLILLGGVTAAYALDRLLDAPTPHRSQVARRFIPPLILGAGIAAYSLAQSPSLFPLVALLALMAGLYVPLKRYIPKGVLTAGAWAMAVTWLPPSTTPDALAGLPFAAAVLLVVGANALLCDAQDVEADRANGIRGLAPLLGEARASRIAAILALLGSSIAMAAGPWPLAAAGFPLSLAGLFPPAPMNKGRRRTLLDLALVLPGIITFALPRHHG
jgi:hypothetical protein